MRGALTEGSGLRRHTISTMPRVQRSVILPTFKQDHIISKSRHFARKETIVGIVHDSAKVRAGIYLSSKLQAD